ncbi:DsbA family oxidoreductase, partial [Streptomyces sp. NPDC006682]
NPPAERPVSDAAVLAERAPAPPPPADEARALLADPEAYAADVRADEREAAELGANAVPFFVLDRRYGISGGQPAEVFTQALEQAWKDREVPGLTQVGGDAAACDADGSCEVPAASASEQRV